MTHAKQTRVVDSLWTFAVAVAVAGPFALPLLWRNPRFGKSAKIWGSVVVLVLTAALMWLTGGVMQRLMEQLQALQALEGAS